ncbi:hypothetical protein U8335_19120 [Roseiconus lacunae]|uniref:hypothetical protein n=1 Tax=Roseiconus lacunae TaxID=2605694 RepID=UPI003093680E|nr:hypothetical protein U8335_19120 [Stieleria sp. HD01]
MNLKTIEQTVQSIHDADNRLTCCPGVTVDNMNGVPILRRGDAYMTLQWRDVPGVIKAGVRRAPGFLCQRA